MKERFGVDDGQSRVSIDSPMKGVMRFKRRGKFSLRYIGPFEILERVDPVAYRLAQSPEISMIHPIFHVSIFANIYRIHKMYYLHPLFN